MEVNGQTSFMPLKEPWFNVGNIMSTVFRAKATKYLKDNSIVIIT
jgi:hypothetical protein